MMWYVSENLEMMIDLVEEEEEIEIQVLLGDYLTVDNSDTCIDMQSSSTSLISHHYFEFFKPKY